MKSSLLQEHLEGDSNPSHHECSTTPEEFYHTLNQKSTPTQSQLAMMLQKPFAAARIKTRLDKQTRGGAIRYFINYKKENDILREDRLRQIHGISPMGHSQIEEQSKALFGMDIYDLIEHIEQKIT